MAEEKIRVIVTVPNQKVITVNKSICDKEHIYAQCNLKANKIALKELSANAYKLYMYFALNQDDYAFALSYVHVYSTTGISEKTYHRAVKELIEKGYLVKEKDKKNQYIFYDGKIDGEYPLVKITGQESKTDQDDKTEVPDKSGQKGNSRLVENTGEILQDNKLNNTINNSSDKDTNLSEMVADAPNKANASESSEEKHKLIKIFRKENIDKIQVYGYEKVFIGNSKFNEILKNLMYTLDENTMLERYISAAKEQGIGRDYTCSYIQEYIYDITEGKS